MSRPIYRHLADKKWRARARLITEQRITQMSVIPDVLPSIDLTASVELSYHGTKLNSSNRIIPRTARSGQRVAVQPGEYVASIVAEQPPKLDVQVFNKGERLVTIAIVDADVPNLEKDGFDYRCQFLETISLHVNLIRIWTGFDRLNLKVAVYILSTYHDKIYDDRS